MSARIIPWILFYVFLAILIAVGMMLFWPGKGMLIPYLTPKDETFTELYFEDHLGLPKKIMVGEPTEVQIVIHNVEGKTINYPVTVTIASETTPSAHIALYDGAVVVDADETKTVPIELTIPIDFVDPLAYQERSKIEFVLKNIGQSIHFFSDAMATSSATPSAQQTDQTASSPAVASPSSPSTQILIPIR